MCLRRTYSIGIILKMFFYLFFYLPVKHIFLHFFYKFTSTKIHFSYKITSKKIHFSDFRKNRLYQLQEVDTKNVQQGNSSLYILNC